MCGASDCLRLGGLRHSDGHRWAANLARYVIDGDKKALGEMGELALAAAQAMANAANGSDVMGGATWKQMGRYVDVCEMMEATNLPREPTEHEVRRSVQWRPCRIRCGRHQSR